MAHECEICGQTCYCDIDDMGGMEQPDDCPHFDQHAQEEKDGSCCDWDWEEFGAGRAR